MDSSASLLTAVAATFFIAGMVKGVTGMGLPTVAMGLLGALLSPVAAAALLIAPSFVTNVWQFLAGPKPWGLVLRLWPMMVAIIVGTLCAAPSLVSGNDSHTTSTLGVVLILYAGWSLFARQLRVPSKLEPLLSPIVGVATGAVSGGTGVFVVPAVPYLQALGLNKDDLVQALGLSFTVSTLALAAGLILYGAFHIDRIGLSLLAIGPAFAGMWAGQVIRRRISPETFRKWFLSCLLLLGAEMLARPLA